MSKRKKPNNFRQKYLSISIIVSLIGLFSGVLLVQRLQTLNRFAQVTQPVMYFTPSEITVPPNSTAETYDIYLDTNGLEVNGAVFEVNFDPSHIQITSILEGDVLSQVISKSVSGGTAYLTVVSADDTKPFVGEGIVASVEFNTLSQSTTTELFFGNNTQIHTKTTSGGLPDNTPPGYINISPLEQPSPTPTIDPNAYCIDPDGGYDIYTKSTVLTNEGEFTDYCDSDATLIEYYCQGGGNPNPNPYAQPDPQDCTAVNMACSDGACVDPALVTPTPSVNPTPTTTQPTPTVTPSNTPTPSPTETPVAPTLPNCTTTNGDANFDGKANGNDFTAWLRNYDPNKTDFVGGPTVGDFNCDGRVDGRDFTDWLRNFRP